MWLKCVKKGEVKERRKMRLTVRDNSDKITLMGETEGRRRDEIEKGN